MAVEYGRLLSSSDRKHMRAYNWRFEAAYAAALLLAHSDGRLTGLDRFRRQLALEAAMRATGAEHKRPAVPTKECGPLTTGAVEILDDLLPRLVEAAREKLETTYWRPPNDDSLAGRETLKGT
jgi:hypothetical protein